VSIGVALSGGGVRGASHIGVLKAFCENHIKIDYISGTSMGAIVAALYACGYTPEEIQDIFKRYDLDRILQVYDKRPKGPVKLLGFVWGLMAKDADQCCGFFNLKKVEKIIEELLLKRGARMMGDTAIFLAIPAADLKQGKTVFFVSDKMVFTPSPQFDYINDVQISQAVRASISYPIVFSPFNLRDYQLTDGGVTTPIPIDVLRRRGASKIIGVNTTVEDNSPKNCYNIVEVASRCIEMMGCQVARCNMQYADLIVHCDLPTATFDFFKMEESIEFGYQEAMRQMPQILSKIYF
jgi:NTE family protein